MSTNNICFLRKISRVVIIIFSFSRVRKYSCRLWVKYIRNRDDDINLKNDSRTVKLITVKPVLSGHSKRITKLVFKTDYRLMQVKSIAECSNGSILQYF